MSTTSSLRGAPSRLSLAFALVTLAGIAACANATTGPHRDDADTNAIEPVEARLDDSDTTDTSRCNHTQGWAC